MKDNLLRATRSRSPSPPGSISSNIGRVPSREDFSHSSHRKTFQSRLVQSLLVLLGVTVAVHHLLLTSPLLQSMVGAGRENEDAPQKQQRALLGDGMSLESLSSSVATSQLSVAEKEGLLRTIEQLTQQKLRQGMPTAAPTASPTVSPTASPTASPTVAPTASPTASPTANPTSKATEEVVVTAKNHSAVITVSDPQINLTETAAVTINNLTPKSPYAYMFVIGGIHEDRPAYKGFVYDVLVATRLLRKLGSTADVVLFTQMSPDSPLDALPQEDTDHLHALNIQIIPLPKPNRESFAGLVFEKFRALQLVQYRRVMFMDADAIPLANLDYMFHLSDADHKSTPTFLKPNMIWATRGEPCNAGLFMLEPEAGGWERLQAIIRRMKEEGKQLPYPHFSWNRGWGYDFEAENDEWHGTIKYGKKWRYHAGHSDQGLLYYWTKFYKRNVSIIIQDKIENWIDAGVNANKTIDGFSKPTLEMNLRLEPLGPYSHENPLVHQFNCDEEKHQQASKYKKPHQCVVPYRDIAHFMGGSKPWMIPDPKSHRKRKNSQKYVAAINLWFDTLEEISKDLKMGLDFVKWHENHDVKEAPLGLMAKFGDIAKEHHATDGEEEDNTQQQQEQQTDKPKETEPPATKRPRRVKYLTKKNNKVAPTTVPVVEGAKQEESTEASEVKQEASTEAKPKDGNNAESNSYGGKAVRMAKRDKQQRQQKQDTAAMSKEMAKAVESFEEAAQADDKEAAKTTDGEADAKKEEEKDDSNKKEEDKKVDDKADSKKEEDKADAKKEEDKADDKKVDDKAGAKKEEDKDEAKTKAEGKQDDKAEANPEPSNKRRRNAKRVKQ